MTELQGREIVPLLTQREQRKRRGFAAMPLEERSRIGRMGGLRTWELGTAHRWTKEEAQAAGKVGGRKSRRGKNKPKTEQA